jgi:pimeloyl-ACP methyl ester carboxylesterase
VAGRAERPPPRGETVDIGGGRRLHLVRAGPAGTRPMVLLEAGSFGFSADWAVVQDKLAALGVGSIAYDRAGLGHSDPGPAPRDALAVAADLEALLAAIGEAGPFIHVGHSMAGLHAHLFAGRNASRIAGLVLVDAVTPASAEDAAAVRIAGHYLRFSKAAAWAAEAGLLAPLRPYGDTIGLTREAGAHKRWAFAHGPHNRAAADEVVQWMTGVRQAKEAGPLRAEWPVAVVTAGPSRLAPAQRALMRAPAHGSRRGLVIHVERANHASLLGRRHADAIVRAIEHVRTAAATT